MKALGERETRRIGQRAWVSAVPQFLGLSAVLWVNGLFLRRGRRWVESTKGKTMGVLISLAEAGRRLGVSPAQVHEYLINGRLKGDESGREPLVYAEDVERLRPEIEAEQVPEAAQDPDDEAPGHP